MAVAKLKRILEAGRRARVLVVDDSTVVRRLITMALQGDPCLEVVGTATNGKEALEQLAKLAPDVVTLDIEMPEMDGLEALRHIRKLSPQIRVVMLSTLTERGAAVTLEALALGADDYTTKQVDGRSVEESTAKLRAELCPKIRQFFSFPAPNSANGSVSPPARSTNTSTEPTLISRSQRPSKTIPQVVAIGISTGGPSALASIIPEVPEDFRLPILIVQHMPALFTKLLCERLQERSQLRVCEAAHGDVVRPGLILVAPGDYHMRVELVSGERHPRIALDQGPPQNSCRPAVDVLFESVANVYGGSALAAVLTGMGHDGLRGARLLKSAGAVVIAQDEKTSAVWGMPRALAEAKIADAILPLNEIIPYIVSSCQRLTTRFELRPQETL
jgi:two-component system chemotaxis response regulator CheB